MSSVDDDLGRLLERFPVGWSDVVFDGRHYGVTKTVHGDGRSLSLLADELGGNDLVSANVYRTADGDVLKPCEMPAEKVLHFLRCARLSD